MVGPDGDYAKATRAVCMISNTTAIDEVLSSIDHKFRPHVLDARQFYAEIGLPPTLSLLAKWLPQFSGFPWRVDGTSPPVSSCCPTGT